METGSAGAPQGEGGLSLGPSPCRQRLLQEETGFPEPDQQALPHLLELGNLQLETEAGGGVSVTTKADEVRAGTHLASTRTIPPQVFLSSSPVVDVPHCRQSNIDSKLPAEGSLGQHQAEPSLRVGAWGIPQGPKGGWFESQGLSTT